MQAAPARYVSVSELYSTDEVELLLDEIRELEPTSCRGEDVQDFEIAGSGCVSGGGGGGGRSPAGTEGTERSWDSHAQYRRVASVPPLPLAPLYCRARYLWSLRGACTLVAAVSGAASCACAWAAVGGARAPPALRPLLLAALTCALLHAALLFVHVTRLTLLLPIHWNNLGLLVALWSATSLCCGSALALRVAPPPAPAPPLAHTHAHDHMATLLYSAAGFGLAGAFAALLLVTSYSLAWCVRRRGGGGGGEAGAARGAYRAVPAAPVDPRPSTSRDNNPL